MNMQDKLGIELANGDTVIYAKGGQSDDSLYVATIVQSGSATTSVRILTHDTNRKLFRRPNELLNVEGLRMSNPEAFI
jgi:hypothetical protein